MIAASPPALVVQVVHKSVPNGGSQTVSVAASKKGKLRIFMVRGTSCPVSFQEGSLLTTTRGRKRVLWTGHLDEVTRPGRYSACAVLKVRGSRAVASGRVFRIRAK